MNEILLVGNPNTGKTTLFNRLTRSDEHVGNWHGVTVEEKSKPFRYNGKDFLLVDLPGIYSLTSLSFEEEVARDYIYLHNKSKILNICDQSNIRRNLYLTLGLLEQGADVVLAVNSVEKKPTLELDVNLLSKRLGILAIAIDAEKGRGTEKLKEALSEKKREVNLSYISKLPIREIKSKLKSFFTENLDFYAIKVMEGDERILKELPEEFKEFVNPEVVAKARYEYIDALLASCAKTSGRVYGSSRLDAIFLNKWLAFPMFFGILAFVFFITFFSLGSWLSDGLSRLLELVISPIQNWIASSFGQSSWITALVSNGLFGGLALVLSFLPQVALLFLCLSILEDSGYLSRIAFMFEDVFSKIGLSGRGVYSLLMGFGCSTSAVLTARTMDDKNAKIKTAMLTPYMSCSAKFPIYLVIGGAFFGAANIFVIMGLYLLGVIVSLVLSLILEKSVLKSKKPSFILEFPPYHLPSFKRAIKVLYQNMKSFVIRVGSVIISTNIIVFLLSNFSFSFAYVGNGGGSMLESIGKIIAPIFIPLGFGNWGAASALLAGLVAKEVVVSSIQLFNGGLALNDPLEIGRAHV